MRRRRRLCIRRTVGYALTVFNSPTISRFGVRVNRVYPDGAVGGGDLILGRAFGSRVDRVNGVPSGASGSPVLLGKRVIGAISSVVGGDTRLVGITPIEAMLALEKEPDSGRLTPDVSDLDTFHERPVIVASSGFRSTRVLSELERRFTAKVHAQSHVARPAMRQIGLQQGGPIGAALMVGDLSLGFIGTVTLVEGDRVFAFGHPLLYSGPAQYPMTTAEILDTARGLFPSKVGVLGRVVGTILQDRGAGILGRLNQTPQGLVNIQLSVTDADREQGVVVNSQAVHIPSELPFLTYIAAFETVIRAMNRVGQGTAQWQWQVTMDGIDEPITLSEEQYDPYNIAYAIASSVFPLLEDPLNLGLHVRSIELKAVVSMVNTMA